ncbi:MAG: DinB family protein [Candidatus Hodarchaeales archaeon]|jgi:hypothetical protein
MNLNEVKGQIRNKLDSTRIELNKTVKTLPENKQNLKISSHEESWTILEVIKHLKASEQGMLRLMQGIKGGGEGVPLNFDLNRYNKSQVNKLENKSLNDVIKDMETNRIDLREFLTNLNEEDFAKKGRHATMKILTTEETFNLIANHEMNHLEKIKEAIDS